MPLALLALTISAYAIGTTEFVIVGLLPTVAGDLGITLPLAGLIVTVYALGSPSALRSSPHSPGTSHASRCFSD